MCYVGFFSVSSRLYFATLGCEYISTIRVLAVDDVEYENQIPVCVNRIKQPIVANPVAEYLAQVAT